MPALTLTANSQSWSVTLTNSSAAQALVEQLPLTLDMAELNGNEKYASLPAALPVQASCPGQIQAGDVMLYGKDCLVLVHELVGRGAPHHGLALVQMVKKIV